MSGLELAARAWDAAPFEPFARTSAAVHDALLRALGVRRGERWLDVATGTGAVALRAALAGARVTGIDVSPRMIAAARAHAVEAGVRLELAVGAAERLPYPDGAFDVVSSAHGVVFALDPPAAAAELARVCRPGGRLGLSALADDAANRELLGLWGRVARPDPLAWGSRERLEKLLGACFELDVGRCVEPLRAPTAEALWRLHVRHCGPLRLLVEGLPAAERDRLRERVLSYFDRYRTRAGIVVPRAFVLVTGRRRRRPGPRSPPAARPRAATLPPYGPTAIRPP